MSWIAQSWQSRGWRACLLLPLSVLYAALISIRRLAYRKGWKTQSPAPIPVVVVGNLSVGGTGKTPLCAHLVSRFQAAGWRPAIVSRGYGGTGYKTPHLVLPDDSARQVGDEPLMLAQQTGVPVCICTNRVAAVAYLANHCDVDIVFSDDGLQHLAMDRAAEIIVIDAARGFGNRWLLPAGPMRDYPNRLSGCDLIVLQQVPGSICHESLKHSGLMTPGSPAMPAFCLRPTQVVNLLSGKAESIESLSKQQVHAVAGIGNPERFFLALQAAGLSLVSHPLPDHHHFQLDDLAFDDGKPVLVTSKDAVKLRTETWLPETIYEVTTDLVPNEQLRLAIDRLDESLRTSRMAVQSKF